MKGLQDDKEVIMALPKKITPCPIIEAIVEIRFSTDLLSDVIIGIVYKSLKDKYPRLNKLHLCLFNTRYLFYSRTHS
ncbi:hypothetical protein MCHI_003591, partial [Candidatus Magnetoovum chiemensis]